MTPACLLSCHVCVHDDTLGRGAGARSIHCLFFSRKTPCRLEARQKINACTHTSNTCTHKQHNTHARTHTKSRGRGKINDKPPLVQAHVTQLKKMGEKKRKAKAKGRERTYIQPLTVRSVCVCVCGKRKRGLTLFAEPLSARARACVCVCVYVCEKKEREQGQASHSSPSL